MKILEIDGVVNSQEAMVSMIMESGLLVIGVN